MAMTRSKYPSIDAIVQRSFRHMGKDDLWRRYTGGSYEESETIGDYKVDFDVQENGDTQFIIWNPDTPCITVYLHGTEATLNFLEYSPRCTIDGKMKRGEGTRKMVNAAFDIARKLGASTIQLVDQSTIQCETGETIKLGPYSFFKTGKTWYEKQFGFYPIAEFQEEYQLAKELRKTLNVENMTCSEFDRKTTNGLLRAVGLDFFGIVWEKDLSR
jgi:hypothetical protein